MSEPGEIVDKVGRVIGHHDGIINFTIGQRRGIGISKDKPVYVKEIDASSNRVVVAEKKYIESSSIHVEKVNILTKYDLKDIYVRVRSTGKLLKANLSKIDEKLYHVQLDKPEIAISPGQACVFYKDLYIFVHDIS